mgnify:CR=1 FL=1
MTYELTNEEKIELVNQHLKNIEFSLFNFSLSLVEEQALSSPNGEVITSLNNQIAQANAKKTALLEELEGLN